MGGAALGYDYLIYAVGGTSAESGVPGAREFAYPIAGGRRQRDWQVRWPGCRTARPCAWWALAPPGSETAAELSRAGRAVTLVCGPVLQAPYREPARKATASCGASWAPTSSTATARPSSRSARMPWYSPTGAGYPAARPSGPPDSAYQIWPDQTDSEPTPSDVCSPTKPLTSLDDDRIVSGRRCRCTSGAPLRMSCQARRRSSPCRRHRAGTHRRYRSPPINQAFTGECVSSGRRGGVIQIARPDDSVLPFTSAARRRQKEAGSARQPWFFLRRARKPGSLFWFQSSRRDITEPVLKP